MATGSEVWEQLKRVRDLVAENPLEGRKEADAALAQLAEVDDPPPDLLGFAAQIDGTAWRATGNYLATKRCYTRAEDIYSNALFKTQDFALQRRLILGEADLWRRWSFLYLELQDWERGLEMLSLAERRFTLADQRHEVGRVYLARGQLLWERDQPGDQDQALEFLSLAVELIDPRKSEGAFQAASTISLVHLLFIPIRHRRASIGPSRPSSAGASPHRQSVGSHATIRASSSAIPTSPFRTRSSATCKGRFFSGSAGLTRHGHSSLRLGCTSWL